MDISIATFHTNYCSAWSDAHQFADIKFAAKSNVAERAYNSNEIMRWIANVFDERISGRSQNTSETRLAGENAAPESIWGDGTWGSSGRAKAWRVHARCTLLFSEA